MRERLERLRRLLATRLPAAGALVIGGSENRRYLSGFRGDAGLLWITQDDAALLTDSRFWVQAAEEAPDWRLLRLERGEAVEHLAGLSSDLATRTVAFEAGWLTYAEYRRWRRSLRGVRLLPAPELVEELRLVKDAGELAAIRRAAEVTDRAFAAWLPGVRAGAVESELAADLEHRLRLAGADGVAFPPIVAGGPRGAMAHAIPGGAALAAGELVVVDVGAVVDGYCSDMTRTVAVPGGEVTADARAVWDTVAAALAAGIANVRPGVPAVEVDAAARRVIAAAGHGERFGHGTGHGVGMAVHEAPRLSPRTPPRVRVPAGAVVTVEPGIYLPGRFGVRLEQLVYVGPQGAEILSQTPLGL